MATTSYMVQLLTEQYAAQLVTSVANLDDEAYLILNPSKNTIVREVASEKLGGILGTELPGPISVGFSTTAFVDVKLVPPHGENYTYFYAPSFNPSPSVKGAVLAILRVRDVGVAATGTGKLGVSRLIGAHTYVDQTD